MFFENIVRKGENAGNQEFLHLTKCVRHRTNNHLQNAFDIEHNHLQNAFDNRTNNHDWVLCTIDASSTNDFNLGAVQNPVFW